MKREILFRGQRTDKKQLVEGDLIHGVGIRKGKMYILPLHVNLASLEGCDPLDGYNVIPETVGQFTGLTDKNGTKIFEGDILNLISPTTNEIKIKNAIVYYSESSFKINKTIGMYSNYLYGWAYSYNIIGNVHDNKELIK